MKKIIITTFLVMITLGLFAQSKTLFDYKVKDIDGKEFDMATLKGKKVMIVNVASKCGYTHQYEKLQALFDKYKDTGFTIIGFPSNDFGKQEPGTDQEIKQFCTSKFNVTFPMMSKIEVAGDNKAPVYKWLTEKNLNGQFDSNVRWNFQKYLINEKGELVNVLSTTTDPFNDVIVKWIEGDTNVAAIQ